MNVVPTQNSNTFLIIKITLPSVDCVWHEWAVWGECSVTCGAGIERRSRTNTPALFNGALCDGDEEEERECFPVHCPGKIYIPSCYTLSCAIQFKVLFFIEIFRLEEFDDKLQTGIRP